MRDETVRGPRQLRQVCTLQTAALALALSTLLPLPEAQASLLFNKGSFAKTTGAAPVSQSITGVGFKPKAVIFFWTKQTTTGLGSESDIAVGYGFASGPLAQRAIASAELNGPASAASRQSRTRCILIVDAAQAPAFRADAQLTSFDPDGFTLNWTTNAAPAAASIVHFIALGGGDLTNALASDFTPTVGAGSQGVAGVGFRPDFVMFLSMDQAAMDTTNTSVAQTSWGLASGPTAQGGIGLNFIPTGAVPPPGGQNSQRTDNAIVELTSTGAAYTKLAALQSFDSGGFTINKTISLDSTPIHFLALRGGRYKVGSFLSTTSMAIPVDQPVTGVGFQPAGLVLTSVGKNVNPGINTEAAASFAGADAISEGTTWFHNNDCCTTARERTSTTSTMIFGGGMVLNAEAVRKSLDPDGFTLTWTTQNNVNPREVLYATFASSCCELTTTEAAGTISVGAPGFQMRWNAAAGGGIDLFYDFDEDGTATTDLAGGDAFHRNLFIDEIVTGAGPFVYYFSSEGFGARLDVLEATPARARVRQTARFGDVGTGNLPDVFATGDYSVYGPGRMALSWNRFKTPAATVNYDTEELEFVTHAGAVPPLNGWASFSDAGPLSPLGPAASAFLLVKNDLVGAHTDFLPISSPPAWPVATQTVGGAAGADAWQTLVRDNNTGSIADTSFRWLLYFKPNNLGSGAMPWLDPAVTGRSADYRGPSAVSVGPGTQWQDAAENTSAAGDFFNESEAAYVYDLNPATGLTFTLDGSTTTRYSPFFKIRRWQSFSETPGVTFDPDGPGPALPRALVKNTSYRAAVKPVARAHWAQRVNFHSTLHDSFAIGNPAVGNPGTVTNIFSFPGARYGNGTQVGGFTEHVAFSTLDFDAAKGAIEFWYRPDYDNTDPLYHDIAGFRTDGANQVVLEKLGTDDSLNLVFRFGGFTSRVQVAAADYGWRPGDWVHFRLQWDDSALPATQLEILLNGAKPLQAASGADYNSALLVLPPDQQFRLGNTDGDVNFSAGIYDELWVYDGNPTPGTSPRALAHGGLTSTNEYLATGGQNLALTFTAVDAGTRQGSYFLIGADSKFRGLGVSLAVPGVSLMAPGTLYWEYWNGVAWDTLEAGTGFTDQTNDFRQSGSVFWTLDPGGWAPYSIGGGPDLYYVRVRLNSGASYSTPPTENVIKTDILLFQYCNDVTTAAATFAFAVPPTTEVKLSSFTAIPGDASVALEWRTASELDNLGFHVYRGSSENGPWTRLTSSLIPGLGSSAVGQAYSFRDKGLTNGTRYFYRLDDVDASSKTTSHGPVSAVPSPAAPAGDGTDGAGRGGDEKKSSAAKCPDWVLVAYGSAVGSDTATASLRCTRHGDPEATALGVASRDSRSATLELRTGGFYALHTQSGAGEPSGTVRVFVPGFDFPQDEKVAALPIRRALTDAVAGRRVQLAGVRALELVRFKGLVPSALGRAEMQVGRDGTVRAARRSSRASAKHFPKGELVSLLPSLFQGERKSAVVEIAPLRFDARRQQLVLAKRVLVRLLFTGREAGESGRGSLGRAPGSRKPVSGELLARLHTMSRGLHAVSFEQLFPGRPRGFAASQLRLERLGEPVAIHVEPATDAFGPGSRLYFFADRAAASTDFSAEVAYALVRAKDGSRMPLVSAAPSDDVVRSASIGTASFETNRFYQPGLLDAPDPWLWESLPSGTTRVRSFSLTGVDGAASGTAALDVFLQGASESGQSVDYHVSVSLGGVLVGEAQFAGKKPYRMSLSLPVSLLREGQNELSLTNVADTGVSSFVFLDRFMLAHPQTSSLAGGRFEGTWSESGTVTVSGVSGALGVLDVTPAGASAGSIPRWLTGFEAAGGSLRFHAEAGRRYLAVSQEALLSPRISWPQPSSLVATTNQADYLLIAPRAFLAAAEPLVQRRQDQGLATRAVAFEEIADDFGHGQASAEAIKAFLAYAFHSWTRPSPRYVLLLGDSSYDPRNFIGTSQPSPLPALWAKTSYLWTVSDPQLAAVNGKDSLPDMAIGRLPASTVEEAQALVAKLLAWEDSGQGLAGPAALVADNPDVAGDFEADVHDIAQSYLTGRNPELLLLRELGAATRPRILDALNSGLSFLSYVGHGGAAVWASENVWNSWDAPSLQAQSQQPLLVTMNCLNGYFVAPAFESLSESLLNTEGRGAIASFSPSGLSLDGPAHQYHRALMAALTSGHHQRLGDAVLAAQRTYMQTGLMPELLGIYHLFGDPALVIGR